MKKKVLKVSIVPIVIGALLFLSFSKKEEPIVTVVSEHPVSPTGELQTVSLVAKTTPKAFQPVLKKSYVACKEAMGFKESRGNYKTINQFGYLGKYQFGKGTLQLIGIYDTIGFLQNPELQEAAFYANASRNKWILKRDIKNYVGKTMHGVEITESGILAAAHLAGPGSVKKYLRSGGSQGFSDAFGTSIRYYLNTFKGYDTSVIVPEKRAKATIANDYRRLKKLEKQTR